MSKSKPCPARRRNRLLLAPLLALAVLMALPATASALVVSVVNERGQPQSDVTVQDHFNPEYGGGAGSDAFTNGAGQVSIFASPGDTIHATRTPEFNEPACNSPEGAEGKTVTVPSPVPAEVTITLPSIGLTPFQPGISNRERGMVGLINNLRREHGDQPVVISTTLSTTADGYSSVLAKTSNWWEQPSPHCLLFSPWARIIDSSFPVAVMNIGTMGENLASAESATEAFTAWLHSPGHLENMLRPVFNAIGIANNGENWVTDYTTVAPGYAKTARAGMNGDTGDASLADTTPSRRSGSEQEWKEGWQRSPRLRFAHIRQHDHWLQVSLSLALEAQPQGRVLLLARQRHQQRALRLSTSLQAKVRLGAGQWRLRAVFIPDSREGPYERTAITRVIRVGAGRTASRASRLMLSQLSCGIIRVKTFTGAKARIRVTIYTGPVSCRTARRVLRYSITHTQDRGNSALGSPRGWNCVNGGPGLVPAAAGYSCEARRPSRRIVIGRFQ